MPLLLYRRLLSMRSWNCWTVVSFAATWSRASIVRDFLKYFATPNVALLAHFNRAEMNWTELHSTGNKMATVDKPAVAHYLFAWRSNSPPQRSPRLKPAILQLRRSCLFLEYLDVRVESNLGSRIGFS